MFEMLIALGLVLLFGAWSWFVFASKWANKP